MEHRVIDDARPRLTRMVDCAGCASKMEADVLERVLRELPAIDDPRVLVATATRDDAGVYELSPDVALVETVDFFTPIVDEPATFGRISAANALSDVYAMGGVPLFAVAIATFPESGLDPQVLHAIVRGGSEKAREAGIHVIGGHTVKDPEPKYGLAVTGRVHPQRIVRNSTAKPGDLLVLTKPLGTGLYTTARRRDVISEDDLQEAVLSMQTLNRGASEAMIAVGVDAATDVTGFGLMGHLRNMTSGSGTGARVDAAAVPLFDLAVSLAERDCAPGGTKANLALALRNGVRFDAGVPEPIRLVLCDAQTSGGLLIAVSEEKTPELLDALDAHGVDAAAVIGAVTAEQGISVG
ncbi:MAG: selenide, water dikinase SelD [Candidatus Eremiobacteraeota bacterium]|nr:selenide, water dikinase SelD [Candidatus Eremiobacteraeota bacterium]MBV8281383.1 selenide, water dikinase SelD [Candidatus Eremiobacteraeota bacterium]